MLNVQWNKFYRASCLVIEAKLVVDGRARAPAAVGADKGVSSQVRLFVPMSRAGRYGLTPVHLFDFSGESENFTR